MYSFSARALASCRCRPLSSNVRPRKIPRGSSSCCVEQPQIRTMHQIETLPPLEPDACCGSSSGASATNLTPRLRFSLCHSGKSVALSFIHWSLQGQLGGNCSLGRTSSSQFVGPQLCLHGGFLVQHVRLRGIQELQKHGSASGRWPKPKTESFGLRYRVHGTVRPAWPNHSLKRSANGRPPGPVWRYAVHFRQPGPGALPLSPA